MSTVNTLWTQFNSLYLLVFWPSNTLKIYTESAVNTHVDLILEKKIMIFQIMTKRN